MRPPAELLAKVLQEGRTPADSGSILVGDKGILFSPNDYGAKFRLTPEKDFAGCRPPARRKGRQGTASDRGIDAS